MAPALEEILQFVQREHQRVENMTRNRPRRRVIPIQRPCNVRVPLNTIGAIKAIRETMSSYGWGRITTRCITLIHTEASETPIAAMKKFQDALNQTLPSILNTLGFKWSNPSVMNMHKYKTKTNKCQLWHYTAYRVAGQWALDADVTSEAITKWLPDWERVYMDETVRVDESGRIVAVPKLMRSRPKKPWKEGEPFITDFVPGTTTHIATWGGAPPGNAFTAEYSVSNNPAIEGAIAKGIATLEQVHDATTVSGIALLIVPVLFTLVPVSAFTDVGRITALAYILFTDVFTVFPLFVKGIELMRYSARRFEATRTQLYSGVRNNETAVVETWYANCNAAKHISVFGIIFLALAIFFMLLGIGIELATRQYMYKKNPKKWKKRKHLMCTVTCEHCQQPTTPAEYLVNPVWASYPRDG